MNLSVFKTELKNATCNLRDDYFLADNGSNDVHVELSNGCTIDIDINANWIEDVENSTDYDSPSIDHSINELELTEVNMYDEGGYNIDVTPDMLECLIDWVGNYFQCETF